MQEANQARPHNEGKFLGNITYLLAFDPFFARQNEDEHKKVIQSVLRDRYLVTDKTRVMRNEYLALKLANLFRGSVKLSSLSKENKLKLTGFAALYAKLYSNMIADLDWYFNSKPTVTIQTIGSKLQVDLDNQTRQLEQELLEQCGGFLSDKALSLLKAEIKFIVDRLDKEEKKLLMSARIPT